MLPDGIAGTLKASLNLKVMGDGVWILSVKICWDREDEYSSVVETNLSELVSDNNWRTNTSNTLSIQTLRVQNEQFSEEKGLILRYTEKEV